MGITTTQSFNFSDYAVNTPLQAVDENWEKTGNDFYVNSAAALVSDYSSVHWYETGNPTQNQKIVADIAAAESSGIRAYLMLSYDPVANTGYMLSIRDNCYLYRVEGGVLGFESSGAKIGKLIEFQSIEEGNAVRLIVKVDGVEELNYLDTSPPNAGYIGLKQAQTTSNKYSSLVVEYEDGVEIATQSVSMTAGVQDYSLTQTHKPSTSAIRMQGYIGPDTATQVHKPQTAAVNMRPALGVYALSQLQSLNALGLYMLPHIGSVDAQQYAAAVEFTATQSGALDLTCVSDTQSAVQWEYDGGFYANPFTETVTAGDVVILRPGTASKVRSIDLSGQPVSYNVNSFAVFTGATAINLENSGAQGESGAFSACGSLTDLRLLNTSITGTASGYYVLSQLQRLELPAGVAMDVAALSTLTDLEILKLYGAGKTGLLSALNNLLPNTLVVENTSVTGAWRVNSGFNGDVSLRGNPALTQTDIETTLTRLAASAVTGKTLDLSGTNESVRAVDQYGTLISRGNTVNINWLPQVPVFASVKVLAQISAKAVTQTQKAGASALKMQALIGASSARKLHEIQAASVAMRPNVGGVAAQQRHKPLVAKLLLRTTAPRYGVGQSHKPVTVKTTFTPFGGPSYLINQSRLLQTAAITLQPTIGTYAVTRSRFPYWLGIGHDSEKEIVLAHRAVMSRNRTLRKVGVANKRHVRFHVDIPHMTPEEAAYLEHWLQEYEDIKFAFSWTDNQQDLPQGEYDWTVELEDETLVIKKLSPVWFSAGFKLYGEEHFFGEKDQEIIN